MTDKPDNVADNPNILPYASNVGAPSIKPDHSLGGWKNSVVLRSNKHYQERFDEIKQQFEQLTQEVHWNNIILNSEMRFKPVIGGEYHLYRKENNKYFMSLFAPHECTWGETHQGTFKLNYDNRWDKI